MRPKLGPTRICACGCRQPLTGMGSWARYLPECRKRCRAALRKELQSLPGRLTMTGKRLAGEPERRKRSLCKVCFDLPERREGTCKGCGREHAKERLRP